MSPRVRGALAFVLLATVLAYGLRRWRTRPMPFDRALWLATQDTRDIGNPRERMADDAVRRLREGMPMAEVLATLGDEGDPGEETRHLRYYTYGIHFRALPITGWYRVVDVDLDRHGRVARAEHTTVGSDF